MKTNTTKTLIALVVTAAVAPMSAAHASNVDVNNFLVKAHGKNFQEAVNAYDNLNQRDRMVVDGIADKTDLGGKFLDIKGVADRLAHTHTATPGWDSSKTQAFIDVSNGKNGIDGAAGKDGINGVDGKDGVTTIITKVETDTATQNQVKANTKAIAGTEIELLGESNLRRVSDVNLQHQINAANAKLQGDELTQMNRDRTANQHVQPVMGHDGADGVNGKDGAAGKDGINGVDGKDGVTTIITKVETDTATQNQVKANTKAIAGTEIELLGESNLRRVSDVNLQHQINAANAKLQGDELTQMNRDRTANQHVQPVVGHDGAGGVNGKDGANGKNGIDGAAGKDGINGVDGKDGVTTIITKVETDTATQNQVKANTKAIAGTEIELLGESNLRRVSDVNLQHQINAANAKLQGDELTQMNRDRTANQHVQPVVGHDGADGVNGKDGVAGKDGINGVDGKDGVTTVITKVETDTATQNQMNVNTDDLKGLQLQQANRDRTANQRVQPVVGHDGVNGANGKDGVTTVITKVETDTATTQQVSNNAASLRAVRTEQDAQGEFVQRQVTVNNQHSARLTQDSADIAHNSQRIDQNAKRIDETKEDLKRGLNNAAAMSSLHFNGNRDSWALSTGSANGEGAALAGGMQKSLTEHTAVTVQYSDSLSGGYMVGAGIHGDW